MATATAIRHGGLRGVVVTAIEPTRLHEVVLSEKRPEEGALAIFDAHGALVYHSDFKDPTWQQRLSWRLGDHILVRVQQTQREQAGIQTLTQQRSGKWVSARVPLPELGWVAGAGRPERVAFQELRQGLVEDAFLGCAVSALAFALAYLLGRSISGPLLRLEEDAQVMGEAKMVLRDDPLAPDEVRSLRDALVTMTGALFQRSVDLRESEVSLRTILDNVYDGIIIHDLQGRIVQVNRRWLEMVRLAPHQVEGLTIPDASAGDPSPEVLGALWRQVLAGESRLFEWRARRPGDGSEFDSEVFLCAIRLKGQDLLMGNVRDVTERKRVAAELQRARDELEIRVQERTAELASAFEELKNETEQRIAAVEELRRKEQLLIQQSRLAAMGEIMVHIAHQWRQPLNTIGLLVQDLALSYQMETLSAEEVETQTKKVMAVLDHLSRTIDDFRNLFSPDKTKAPFSTRDVVERALSLLSPEFKETQVEMELLCDERDCEVEGFRNEYLQVILNVLSNARDVLRANQVAHPRITIRLFRESGRSVVTVADNGGGINPAIIGRIFDPYFTTKGQDKGTGIGLFMSKTIIEKNMGGSLSARNTEDGAEFRIEL